MARGNGARPARRAATKELPPPLPPGERTVGQLVAETIRAYGARFWRALPLGLPLAVADQLSVHHTVGAQVLVFWIVGPLFVAGFLWACRLLHDAPITRTAVLVGALVYVPFPVLRAVYILPGLAWFALLGLAVPAAMVEGLGFRDALIRGRRLGVADFAHALGSLAALVVVVGVADNVLSSLLHTQGDNGQRVAVFLSDLVLGPLLFLGGAMLYDDQAARIGSRRRRAKEPRDADLHPPVDADAAGGSDPQVES
ncbi:MAG TPA: hypothetical protein VHC45_15865 [Gaiellaceae bacterium]|nr:hypothetical protein [Gaiellaceae bacterium]